MIVTLIKTKPGDTIEVYHNTSDEISIEIKTHITKSSISISANDAAFLIELLNKEIQSIRDTIGYSKSEREDMLADAIKNNSK
jgi:hypothetical protein